MPKAICSVEGCEEASRKRGMCNTHYQADLRAMGKGRTLYAVTCVGCGNEFASQRKTGKLCSDECRALVYAHGLVSPLPKDHPVMIFVDTRTTSLSPEHPVSVLIRQQKSQTRRLASDLRLAIDRGDTHAIIAAVQRRCRVDGECWIWNHRDKDGYPVLRVESKAGKANYRVHRLVLEAKHGKPLGKQAAHHICANTMCVNPDHLQPVTHRDNVAEMLARTYMESRIADLEDALADLNPDHPLLHQIGVIRAA